MALDGVPDELVALVRKMHDEYTASEVEIARALANARGPLSIAELAEETGYTERTVQKRVGTLEEQLRGPPLIDRNSEDHPVLHPEFATAIRRVEPDD